MKEFSHKDVALVDFVAERLNDCGVRFSRPLITRIIIDDGYEGNADRAVSDEEFMAALELKSMGFDVRKKGGA